MILLNFNFELFEQRLDSSYAVQRLQMYLVYRAPFRCSGCAFQVQLLPQAFCRERNERREANCQGADEVCRDVQSVAAVFWIFLQRLPRLLVLYLLVACRTELQRGVESVSAP